MLYATMKKNKEEGIDLVEYVEELITCVGTLFGNKSYDNNKYVDGDYTEWDKLYQDYTVEEIEKECWKRIKEEFQYATKGDMYRYGEYVFDIIDCGDYVYKDIENLCKEGKLQKSDIIKINRGVKKKGHKIYLEERYGENNIYCRYLTTEDLADKYFPCTSDENGCTNCHNCD